MPKITRTKKQSPEKIYLQWFDPIDFQEAEEVTWCVDMINDHDPEYVRKDVHDDLLEACIKIVEYAAHFHPCNYNNDECTCGRNESIRATRAAIAKAKRFINKQ